MTVRDLLIVFQIAVCAVLITSSMVSVRGLTRSLHSKLGIEPRNAMLVETDLNMGGYKGDRVVAMQQGMIGAVRALPGVAQVGLVSRPPLHMGWDIVDTFTD